MTTVAAGSVSAGSAASSVPVEREEEVNPTRVASFLTTSVD